MLTWHDVFYYIKLFLRWWFVLALAVLLATGTAWYVMGRQPDMYTAQTTLSVGTNFSVAAPDQAQVALSNVLADYYAALAKREVILGPVIEELQLSFPWGIIRDRMLTLRVDRGANLLEVRISDTSPERAAAIANAIGASLIAFTPNSPEKIEAQQSEINRQLQEAQRNLQAVETRITELQTRLSTLSSAIDIADIQNQLQVLQATRDQYLDNYSKLVGLSNQTLVNSLAVFEAAAPSPFPVPKKTTLTMAMAGAGGMVLAVLAILVLDMLDERWRTGNELQSRTGIKSLGEVPETPPTVAAPPALAARRERAVSTTYANMVLAARSRLPRSLLVSSAQTSASRSSVAIDLAGMYARTGHRVILVDAESGPSNLLEQLDRAAEQVAQSDWSRPSYAQPPPGDAANGMLAHLKPTALHNVLVFSGRAAGHERLSTLIPLAYWPEMVDHLHKVADVVIFDGPAALNGPDAGILAPLVDGALLVLDGRQDSRSVAIKARKHLGSDPNNGFLGAIVVGRAPGGLPKAQPTQPQLGTGKGLRFAVSRQGITITMGAPNNRQPATTSAAASSTAPRLLNPPYAEAQPAPANNTADEVLRWEDLVKIGKTAEEARAPIVAAADVPPRSSVIITPPPAEAAQPAPSSGGWKVSHIPTQGVKAAAESPAPPLRARSVGQHDSGLDAVEAPSTPQPRRARNVGQRVQRTRVTRARRKVGFDG